MAHQAFYGYIAPQLKQRPLEEKELKQADYLDILFEDRNKGYGAYKLRRSYPDQVLKGFGVAIGMILIVLFWPQLRDLLNFWDNAPDMTQVVYVDQTPPPAGALTPQYVPPPPPAPPKNIPPVIVKEEVPEQEIEEPVKETPDVETPSDTGTSTVAEGSAAGDSKGKIHLSVEQRPEFPGGQDRLVEFLRRNIQYPADDKMMNRQGKVFVSFIVNADGTLEDIRVANGVSPSLDAEALRLVKSMPRWHPGRQKGEAVRVYVRLPIVFRLSAN